MKLKKFLLLLPLIALGLVGCGTRNTADPTPDPGVVDPDLGDDPTDPTDPEDPDPVEPVDPDPSDPESPSDPSDPEEPTDPDPEDPDPEDPSDPSDPEDPTDPVDPDPEDPVDEVDNHELAIEALKGLKTIGIEGLYTVTTTYYAGTENQTSYSYECDCAGIYTEDYIWAYHMYNSTGYESDTVIVNHDGLCAYASLNRRNEVEYEDVTDYYGSTSNFSDVYYQPFTYVSKDNTTWDDENLTLTIELASVEDNLELFGELFVDDMHDPEYVEIGFDSNMAPSTASFDHEYESYTVLYRRKYDGEFVDVSELEDNVELAKPYETYDEAEGLQAILDTLKNAESYTVKVEGMEEYIYGLFNKNQGVLQYYAYDGYSGTLNTEEDGYYVTFDGYSGTTANANSGNIAGNAYDGYFAAGASGITPDYDVAAELFQYEGVDEEDGTAVYGIRMALGTSIYPYLLPAYPLIEQAYGSGSFLNSYESVYIDGELTDKYYHLQISGTTTNPKMTFSYYASDGFIYTDTIVFSDLNSTTIPLTSIKYPSKWSDLLSDDIDELDLALNGQDTNGTLSFDDDVPFILFNNNTWTMDQCILSATAANFYLFDTSFSNVLDMFEEYEKVITDAGYTTSSSGGTSGQSAYGIYQNSAGTIEIDLEAYQYDSSSYILDLYVYGLEGDFQTLITNLVGGSNYVSAYESYYTFSVGLSTIGSVFPYVNPSLGYDDFLLVYTDDNTYYWGLTCVSLYYYYYSYVQTYINYLYSAVSPVYTAAGWTEETITSDSLTYYQWSYTDGDTTYTLQATVASGSYYYYICLMFGSTVVTSSE